MVSSPKKRTEEEKTVEFSTRPFWNNGTSPFWISKGKRSQLDGLTQYGFHQIHSSQLRGDREFNATRETWLTCQRIFGSFWVPSFSASFVQNASFHEVRVKILLEEFNGFWLHDRNFPRMQEQSYLDAENPSRLIQNDLSLPPGSVQSKQCDNNSSTCPR